MEEEVTKLSPIEIVANIAEFANAVAAMAVGHRKILVEGGFDLNMADQMCAALHAQLLGLVQPEWEPEFEIEYMTGEDDE